MDSFFKAAWKQYSEITSDAPRVAELLAARGEKLVNDHVAYRTFNLPKISRQRIRRVFQAWGYEAMPELRFEEKKLLATPLIHEDPSLPKVFVSELLLDECSTALKDWVHSFASDAAVYSGSSLLEPLWGPVAHADYQRFYDESEYASWTAAFSLRVNHFTVFVNRLSTFGSLGELNDFLIAQGFALNASGGVIKGTPQDLLEQSSTIARRIPWKFLEGSHEIPSCYYEFARRYIDPATGGLFQGFIPKSADKIFESTSEKAAKIDGISA